MIPLIETEWRAADHVAPQLLPHKGHVLVIEDEEHLREFVGIILEQEGYEVSLADNGREALNRLYGDLRPDVILLDLKMPVMDGWEFRAAQKNDPALARIPVLALSGDGGAQASAISAEGYLLKPVNAEELLGRIESILSQEKQRAAARVDETQRLMALGRLAAGVGHEINNPLSYLLMNLGEVRATLAASSHTIETTPGVPLLPEIELEVMKARMKDVVEMLETCQLGIRRIHETVENLQRLTRSDEPDRRPLDVHAIIDQSLSMAWNQIRHRARLVKTLGKIPPIPGSSMALRRLFLNLLINAVQAIPEGDADGNEIRVSTSTEVSEHGAEVVVTFSDSGEGMTPEIMSHVFEPYFTTKPVGQGTGLGLSVGRQTVTDHGGRITVESEPGKGTVFRVFLPLGDHTEKG